MKTLTVNEARTVIGDMIARGALTDPEANVLAAYAVRDEAVQTARDLEAVNLQLRRALGFLLGHQDSNVAAATDGALRRYHLDPGAVMHQPDPPASSWWQRRKAGA